MGSDYRLLTVWRVDGRVEEVMAILDDGASLQRWWPSVYLSVEPLEDGDEDGVGRTAALHTKGRLPYTLHWVLRITEPVTRTGFALSATGDLEGTGRWTFEQVGPEVVVTFDWRVRAAKPALRLLTPVLRPVFSANHRWAMARGEESLRLELRGRRIQHDACGDAIPPSPQPAFRRRQRG